MDQNPVNATIERYRSLARRFRQGDIGRSGLKIARAAAKHVTEPHLLELHDAVVFSGEWFVGVGREVLCDLFLQTPSPPHSAYLVRFVAGQVELVLEEPLDLSATSAFLLGGCANYCHWLLDYLPRLALYDRADIPLLVNMPVTSFQRQSLELLGIAESRLICLDYPRTYRVRHLFYPSIASSSIVPPHAFRPEIVAWLRKRFRDVAGGGQGHRKLFISRARESDAYRRRLLNHAEVIAVAQRMGFEIIEPQTLSFLDQIRLFSQAAVICGAHGAGLANIVFAPEDARVVELIGPRLGENPVSQIFQNVAKLLGQTFSRLIGSSDVRAPIVLNHLPYETYTIDPFALERLLRD